MSTLLNSSCLAGPSIAKSSILSSRAKKLSMVFLSNTASGFKISAY